MRKRLSALLWSAVLTASAAAFASASQVSASQTPAGNLDHAATQAPAPARTTVRMRGTIGQYDATSRMLSLTTGQGTVEFLVAPSVRVSRSGRKLDVSALTTLSGYRAAVRYSESGRSRTIESVNVFDKDERTGR